MVAQTGTVVRPRESRTGTSSSQSSPERTLRPLPSRQPERDSVTATGWYRRLSRGESSSERSGSPGTPGSEPESVPEGRPTSHLSSTEPYPDDRYAPREATIPGGRVERVEARAGTVVGHREGEVGMSSSQSNPERTRMPYVPPPLRGPEGARILATGWDKRLSRGDSSSEQSEAPSISGREPRSVPCGRPTSRPSSTEPLFQADWYAPMVATKPGGYVAEIEDRMRRDTEDKEDPELFVLALNLPGGKWASPAETPRNEDPLRHFLGDTYVLVWGVFTSVRVLKELYNSHAYLNAPSESIDPAEWYTSQPIGSREMEEVYDEHLRSNLRKAPRGVRMIRASELWDERRVAEMWAVAVRTPHAYLHLHGGLLRRAPPRPTILATEAAWAVLGRLSRYHRECLHRFGSTTLPEAGWRGITPALLSALDWRNLPGGEVLPFPDRDRQTIRLSFRTRSGIRLEAQFDGNEMEAEALRLYWEENELLQRVATPGTLQGTLEGNGHESLPKAGAVLSLLREQLSSGRMLAVFGKHDLRRLHAPSPSFSSSPPTSSSTLGTLVHAQQERHSSGRMLAIFGKHDLRKFAPPPSSATPEPLRQPTVVPTTSSRTPTFVQMLRRSGKEPVGSIAPPLSAHIQPPLTTVVDRVEPGSPAARTGSSIGSSSAEYRPASRCTLDVPLQYEITAWRVYTDWVRPSGKTETSFYEWAIQFGCPSLIHQSLSGHCMRQPLLTYVERMPTTLSARAKTKEVCSRCGDLRRCRTGPAWIGQEPTEPVRIEDAKFCGKCIPDAVQCSGGRGVQYVDGTYTPTHQSRKERKAERDARLRNPPVCAQDRMPQTPHRSPHSSSSCAPSASNRGRSRHGGSSDSSRGGRGSGGASQGHQSSQRARRRARARAHTASVAERARAMMPPVAAAERDARGRNPTVYAQGRMLQTPHRGPCSGSGGSSRNTSSPDGSGKSRLSSSRDGRRDGRGSVCAGQDSRRSQKRARRRARARAQAAGVAEHTRETTLPVAAAVTPGPLPAETHEEDRAYDVSRECWPEMEDAFTTGTHSGASTMSRAEGRSRCTSAAQRFTVYRNTQPVAAATSQRTAPARRDARRLSRRPPTPSRRLTIAEPFATVVPITQRPRVLAYTGCHHCRSMEHLMRECPLPLQPLHNLRILCALGKAVLEDGYPFSPEMRDHFRGNFAEDLYAILEQGIPDTDEFLPSQQRGQLLSFARALTEDSADEEGDGDPL